MPCWLGGVLLLLFFKKKKQIDTATGKFQPLAQYAQELPGNFERRFGTVFEKPAAQAPARLGTFHGFRFAPKGIYTSKRCRFW